MYTLYFVVAFLRLAWSSQDNWDVTNCPQHCTCLIEADLKKVYCDIQNKQKLTAIPDRFPADTQYLTLKGNRISIIPDGAFSRLRDIRYLDLASNELERLPANIFQGLTTLESLNLSKNRLGQLPSGLLRGLTSLRELFLDDNVLENLPKDFFHGLTSLRKLYLDSNKFYTLSAKLFNLRETAIRRPSTTVIGNLTSLVELLLNHNGIEKVQNDSFNSMPDLKRLKLNNNNITTLPRGIFRDLKSLRLLSLYKNPFQCTCSLKWLKDWIIENKKYVIVFHKHLIKCEGPEKLRGKPLLRVKDDEFGCEEEWTDWSNWNSCSKLCNHGTQSRSRECRAGSCEGSSSETRWCNTHKCETKWSPWSVWTSCSVTCSMGYQTRSRSTQCTQSPCQRQLESEVRACPRKDCPSYTEWSSWSMCDVQCGQGTQIRKRECTSSHFGLTCPGRKVESQNCKIRDCAEWAEWGMWSTCSKSCSKGEQTRERDCVLVHGYKQQNCPGNGTDRRECNIKPCPVAGSWSSWSVWESCSKTCGPGHKVRRRKCSNPYPQHGGTHCKGSNFELKYCLRKFCNDTSEFTPWSEWSQCSTRCGEGFKSRSRSCRKRHGETGEPMCLSSFHKDYQICVGENCTGVWGEWTPWSKCVSLGQCNTGQKFRARYCVDDEGRPGYTCMNKTIDYHVERCKPSTCNQTPLWSNWGAWSACSRSCAGGTKRRQRYCVSNIIGKPCPGDQRSKSPCNIQPCPIHGGWSSWGEWGKCNEVCGGGGIKQRNRTCTEPVPRYNGQACIGDSKDKTICNTHSGSVHIVEDKPNLKTEIKLEKPSVCPTPPMPKNGKHTMKKQKDEHIFLEYKCNDFYRNVGFSQFRYCQEDGTWSGYPAECVPDCGEREDKQEEDNKIKSITYLRDSWPWQVAIEVPMKGVHCGGTLIGDQWVLTAAHCVLQHKGDYFEEIKVILGTHNLTDRSSKNVQIILAEKKRYHKDFNWDSFNSDIAILKLERKVHITKHVHPVCLPKSKRRKRLIHVGNVGVIVGWGSKQEPNLLRQMPLPVVTNKDCKQSYKRNNYSVTEKMLCAGYSDTIDGLCKKDSGGGFVFLDKSKSKSRRNRWVLGGIASWRYPKCRQEVKYSVFTDVTKHMDWILKKMHKKREWS